MNDQDLGQLLEAFSTGEPEAQGTALRVILSQRKQHLAAADARFELGLRRLVSALGTGTAVDQRLIAVATLMRVASVVKRLRARVYDDITLALVDPLGDLVLLSDPDDREYVAEACGRIRQPWVAAYVARAAVREESGEKARCAFVAALLSVMPDLECAVRQLADCFKDWKPATEDPTQSSARRIRRILAALRAGLIGRDVEPGESPGAAVGQLVKSAIGDASALDGEVASEAAEEVAAVVHELVRLRFSLAIDPETYSALRVARVWFLPTRWERFTEASDACALVSRDVTEAILILARQSKADEQLADVLVAARGSRDRARASMKELAQRSGLAAEIRSWLADGRRGSPVVVQHSLGESAAADEAGRLGDVLVDAQRLRLADAACRREIFPELEMLQPELTRQLERVLNFALAVCDGVELACRRRNIRLRGSPGMEEEYAPLEHELIDGSIGPRRVKIIRPVVEQIRVDGTPFVIRKGVVESAS